MINDAAAAADDDDAGGDDDDGDSDGNNDDLFSVWFSFLLWAQQTQLTFTALESKAFIYIKSQATHSKMCFTHTLKYKWMNK